MSHASAYSKEVVATLNYRIAEAELRSRAAADRLAALTRTEADTVEAQRQLWEEMDALLALRRQLWELRSSKSE
jgi:hypothetical protein